MKEKIKKFEQIKPLSDTEFVEFLKSLGDHVRHKVANIILMNPGISGKEILAHTHISQPTLSFHIAQLLKAKIIIDKRQGQSHTYFINYSEVARFHKKLLTIHEAKKDDVWQSYSKLIKELKK